MSLLPRSEKKTKPNEAKRTAFLFSLFFFSDGQRKVSNEAEFFDHRKTCHSWPCWQCSEIDAVSHTTTHPRTFTFKKKTMPMDHPTLSTDHTKHTPWCGSWIFAKIEGLGRILSAEKARQKDFSYF
jgi:hypothetical protein